MVWCRSQAGWTYVLDSQRRRFVSRVIEGRRLKSLEAAARCSFGQMWVYQVWMVAARQSRAGRRLVNTLGPHAGTCGSPICSTERRFPRAGRTAVVAAQRGSWAAKEENKDVRRH
jgi:hypothetical protein